jgi:hypothetical protein
MENDKENQLDFYGRMSSIVTQDKGSRNGKEPQMYRLGLGPDEKRTYI